MAAIIVSTMSLATLAMAGQRPSIPEVISWLDEETLILLFSMMILVAIMAETGIFDFLAVFTFEVSLLECIRSEKLTMVFLRIDLYVYDSTYIEFNGTINSVS